MNDDFRYLMPSSDEQTTLSDDAAVRIAKVVNDARLLASITMNLKDERSRAVFGYLCGAPEVGDLVFEETHTMRFRGIAFDVCSVGTVLKIELDPIRGKLTTLLTLYGVEQRWENAHFLRIPTALKMFELMGG